MKLGTNSPNPGDVDDDSLYAKLKKISPINAKTIDDIKWYSNTFNENEQAIIPAAGVHKFLNENEKNSSDTSYPYDFSYHINEMGYRDELPQQSASNIMAFIGCSFTFGEGLASEHNFPHKVSKHFNKTCLNLGLSGTGAIRQSLIFAASCNIWNIDTAVITLPNWARFNYVDRNCYLKSIHLPYYYPNNPECENIRKFMIMDFSDEYMLAATKDAINQIAMTAKMHNVKLILSSWDGSIMKMINSILDYDVPGYNLWMPGSPMKEGDLARDNMHPGINLVNQYTEKLIHTINQCNYVKL